MRVLLVAFGAILLFSVWTLLSTHTTGGTAWPLGIDLVYALGFYGLIVGGLWVVQIGREPGQN